MVASGDGWTWEWIALAIFVLAMLLFVGAVVGFALRRRGKEGLAARACGRCGYDVRGLPTFFCPECGSDLREVGISSGTPPGVMTLLAGALAVGRGRMLVWSVVIVVLTLAVMTSALAFVLRYNVEPVAEVTLEPDSKAYRLKVTSTGRMRPASGWWHAKVDKLIGQNFIVCVAPPGGVADYNNDLRVDLQTWSSSTFHWVGGTAQTPNGGGFGAGGVGAVFLGDEDRHQAAGGGGGARFVAEGDR
jgi:hypothetical protein